MEEVLKSDNQEIKRSWQSKVLIAINIIGILFCFYSIFLTTTDKYKEEILVQVKKSTEPLVSLYGEFDEEVVQEMVKTSIITNIISLIFVILIISVFTLGFYKGWRWSIILNLVFSVLGVIVYVISFLFSKSDNIIYVIFNLVFCLITTYLSISCLKHPFYNQKKLNK